MFIVYKLSVHPSTWALIGIVVTDVDWNHTGTVLWVIGVFFWVENTTPNTNRMQETVGADVNKCWMLHLLFNKDPSTKKKKMVAVEMRGYLVLTHALHPHVWHKQQRDDALHCM